MSGVNEWLISLSEYIGGMSDELDNAKSENAKLRHDLEEANNQAEEVCTENAKLRELVVDMWRDGMCECDEFGACAQCEYHFLDRMRELGVEVDDG